MAPQAVMEGIIRETGECTSCEISCSSFHCLATIAVKGNEVGNDRISNYTHTIVRLNQDITVSPTPCNFHLGKKREKRESIKIFESNDLDIFGFFSFSFTLFLKL